MATGWMKSLGCKSKASDDVVEYHTLRRNNHHNSSKIYHHNHYNRLTTSASCRNTATKDTVAKSKKPVPRKREPGSDQSAVQSRATVSTTTRQSHVTDTCFRALTELQVGYPSRNVVEIIFHTSWGPKNFSGEIETIFKVQNLARTVARFEEYREMVKSKAGSGSGAAVDGGGDDHARCVADGNEVMRFYCLGPTNGGAYDSGWSFHRGKGAAICTFSGSGEAHESAGGGRGRRAMLVCRVIAGRIGKQLGFNSLLGGPDGYDSVSRENGELLVFDTRALLPCFLIIYKL